MRDKAVFSLSGIIQIGHVGENEVRDIQIDIGQLLRQWPELTPQLVAVRPGEKSLYPCRQRIEGDVLIWEVTSSDTAIAGCGECRVHMVDAHGRIGKSIIARTVIRGGMEGEMQDEPPEAAKPWVDRVLASVESVKEGYVANDQGEENAGMALVVGEDGFVTLGEGKGIDEETLFDTLNRWGLIQGLRDGDGAYLADADDSILTI